MPAPLAGTLDRAVVAGRFKHPDGTLNMVRTAFLRHPLLQVSKHCGGMWNGSHTAHCHCLCSAAVGYRTSMHLPNRS